eukprot:gene14499-20525_t
MSTRPMHAQPLHRVDKALDAPRRPSSSGSSWEQSPVAIVARARLTAAATRNAYPSHPRSSSREGRVQQQKKEDPPSRGKLKQQSQSQTLPQPRSQPQIQSQSQSQPQPQPQPRSLPQPQPQRTQLPSPTQRAEHEHRSPIRHKAQSHLASPSQPRPKPKPKALQQQQHVSRPNAGASPKRVGPAPIALQTKTHPAQYSSMQYRTQFSSPHPRQYSSVQYETQYSSPHRASAPSEAGTNASWWRPSSSDSELGELKAASVHMSRGEVTTEITASGAETSEGNRKRLAVLEEAWQARGLHGANSVTVLAQQKHHIGWEMMAPDNFAKFYRFAFFMCKQASRKFVQIDVALAAWRLLLQGRFRLLDQWCDFVSAEERKGAVKVINEDQWRQILDFSRNVYEDLSNFDPTGAWVCILDDFVDHLHLHRSTHHQATLSLIRPDLVLESALSLGLGDSQPLMRSVSPSCGSKRKGPSVDVEVVAEQLSTLPLSSTGTLDLETDLTRMLELAPAKRQAMSSPTACLHPSMTGTSQHQ